MKKNSIIRLAALALLTLFTTLTYAQPSGHPGGFPGGGFPGGGHPGGFPGGRRPDMNNPQFRERMDKQSQQVRQKKIVREGSTFHVVGSLRDSVSQESVPFVNVAVLDAKDSTFVKGGSTNIDGYFDIDGITAGNYLLRVSAIGFQNRFYPFSVTNNTAIGVLLLKPGATLLQEVKITADRPLYAMDGEKMIYNVSDDPTIQTGTTTDALQNAPGVEVDIEGNITLRGVSSVEIWVNDKPSKLTSENLKTYLETLPANALDRIEAITNPSAKYATEAEAVINIITSAYIKSNHFISFGVNGATQPNVSPWISYTWAKQRISINAFASGRYSYRTNGSASEAWTRRNNTSDGYDTIKHESDTANSYNRNYGANLSLNINYQINPKTDLDFYSNGNFNGSNGFNGTFAERDELLLNTLYQYGDTSETLNRSYFGMMGADITHKFDNEGHNLRVGISSNMSYNNNDQYYNRTFSAGPGSDFDKYHNTVQNYYNIGLNGRYNRPYSHDGELSFGLRANHSGNDNYYHRLLADASGDYTIIDTLRQYHFVGNDDNATADVNWTHRWNGFTLELGLGGGYTRTKFAYENQYFPDDTSIAFLTFNPSLHLSYRTQSMHNYKLNYSLRMRTPNEANLTTFRTYGEDSYRVGNRNLQPYYTHSAELGWTKFFERLGSIGIEGYARYSTNEISSLTDVTEGIDTYLDRIVNYSMPYNMGSSYRIGGTAHAMFRPSGFFNLRLYANIYDYGYAMQYNQNGHHLDINNHKVSWSVRLNGWAKIFNQYQLHASVNYSSPTIGLLSESKARYFVNCGVRSDFFKRKLSVYVNVQDIFNWGKTIGGGSSTSNPFYLSNSTTRTFNSRYISAGVTLRFGKMELEKRTTEGSEESALTTE